MSWTTIRSHPLEISLLENVQIASVSWTEIDLFVPPLSPAARTAAARSGLAAPSTIRLSTRPGAGMRIICVRLEPT
jgi:hypothetical protein